MNKVGSKGWSSELSEVSDYCGVRLRWSLGAHDPINSLVCNSTWYIAASEA